MELILCGSCLVVCTVISVLQFCEKGFLFNNAYVYASKEERAKMNKKPHYRQSAIVFALLAGVFGCALLGALIKAAWPRWLGGGLVIATLVYAVASSVRLAKEE